MNTGSAFAMMEKQSQEEVENERDALFFQLMIMRENIYEISKKWQVLGIEPDQHNNWTVIFLKDDKNQCQVMAKTCDDKYEGNWDFAIQGHYYDNFKLHIDDVKGEPNQGLGSICMKHLKAYAIDQNINRITGKLVKRDWDHLNRLVHFYQKHDFEVNINEKQHEGFIEGSPN
ncbi:GNAT family N-acetyltransferase [Salisediminibacterium beveridgei]|uniref:N-acetyltransferase domain-containing protein n=1 Tax=Salisediminibacterium beveridgei TaxID=632773 RepID=A0A1D7QVG4_9BACI|nr:GNAT family N-acetyltransferase [Salisediminibacterium beveridgei]AOM82969.1 hypothetical protein BBEV_1608 [Salisediminibacterium beveridgei]